MNIFEGLLIAIPCVMVLYVTLMLVDIKRFSKSIEKAYNSNSLDIKKVNREMLKISISIFIISVFFGGLLIGIKCMNGADMIEFAFNFNYATSHYYKDVDRQGLLNKAFDTVLKEFHDEYSYSLIGEEEEEYEDEKIIGSNYFKKEGNKKYTVTSQNFVKNRKDNQIYRLKYVFS